MAKKKKTLTNQELERAKDYAKLLYTAQDITNQKELSDRVGVSVTTINKWINADNEYWKQLRESQLTTKDSELRRLKMQLTELNDKIFAKPKGERFSDSKEADILSKLTASIRQLETDLSISEAIETLLRFGNYLKPLDYQMAKEIAFLGDGFIKSLMK